MHGKNQLIRLTFIFHLCLFILPCSVAPLLGEEQVTEEERDLSSFIPNVWEEEKAIWSAPFRKKTWNYPSAWIFSGAAAGSFLLDDGFSQSMRENESFADLNRVFASDTMEMVTWFYPVAALAAGTISKSSSFSEYGWKLSEGALNAFIVARATKLAAGRERPHTGRTYDFWEGGNSFPSGHSVIAWTMAEITVRHYRDRKWVPWVAYPLAGLVSFSRISSGNHYASDVVTGSLVGFSIGHWAIK